MPAASDSNSYRGRIAPSPTGLLHLGHARTFSIAAACAKRNHGQLIFRNEDVDSQRCRAEFVSAMFEDLRWLGIEWSEGPDWRPVRPLRAERAAAILPRGLEEFARPGIHLSVHLFAERRNAVGGS